MTFALKLSRSLSYPPPKEGLINGLINTLPKELLEKIFDFLTLQGLYTASLVCKSWRELIASSSEIWQNKTLHIFQCSLSVLVKEKNCTYKLAFPQLKAFFPFFENKSTLKKMTMWENYYFVAKKNTVTVSNGNEEWVVKSAKNIMPYQAIDVENGWLFTLDNAGRISQWNLTTQICVKSYKLSNLVEKIEESTLVRTLKAFWVQQEKIIVGVSENELNPAQYQTYLKTGRLPHTSIFSYLVVSYRKDARKNSHDLFLRDNKTALNPYQCKILNNQLYLLGEDVERNLCLTRWNLINDIARSTLCNQTRLEFYFDLREWRSASFTFHRDRIVVVNTGYIVNKLVVEEFIQVADEMQLQTRRDILPPLSLRGAMIYKIAIISERLFLRFRRENTTLIHCFNFRTLEFLGEINDFETRTFEDVCLQLTRPPFSGPFPINRPLKRRHSEFSL